MDRRYLIAALFFTIAVIAVFVFTYPKYQTVTSSARLVEEKRKELDLQMALVQDISRLRSQYKEVKDEFARVELLVPVYNEGSIANLFVELEGLSGRNGVLLDGISFSQSKSLAKEKGKEKEKRYRIVNASVSLKGDYRGLKNFIQTIETNEHLMDITKISVAAVKEQEKEGDVTTITQTLSLTIGIDAYYQ